MKGELLLYGATGYTGRLVLDAALAAGLRPVLGGRDEARLRALAEPRRLSHRVAALDDPGALAAALDGVVVVLNVAGPFSATARPLVDACLHVGCHYLDVAGEVLVLDAIAARHAEAKRRGVMLLPAAGFDVVPSDCLATHVARRLPHATRLAIGIRGLAMATRGSVKTFVELPASSPRIRRDGVLVDITPGSVERTFDYGDGPRASLAVSWGDLAAAYYSTGIPNVEVYFEATPWLRAAHMNARWAGWLLATPPWQAWLKVLASFAPEGPTEAERARVSMVIVAEAEDAAGRRAAARLRTPEAYTFTGTTAAEVARRVLAGDVEPGFQTPGRHFGPDFVLGFDRVTREDLA